MPAKGKLKTYTITCPVQECPAKVTVGVWNVAIDETYEPIERLGDLARCSIETRNCRHAAEGCLRLIAWQHDMQ